MNSVNDSFESSDLQVGDAVVIRTPDRREYRGHLVELRTSHSGRPAAVVRLDTGWLTTYPLHMVHREGAGRG